MIRTKEGGIAYEHSMNHDIEFFSKAGSRYNTKKSADFYEGNESALSLFKKVWITDKPLAFKLALWLRDWRGGAGNRSGFRSIIKWLAEKSPAWVEYNIDWIPKLGRWDDLRVLFAERAHTGVPSRGPVTTIPFAVSVFSASRTRVRLTASSSPIAGLDRKRVAGAVAPADDPAGDRVDGNLPALGAEHDIRMMIGVNAYGL